MFVDVREGHRNLGISRRKSVLHVLNRASIRLPTPDFQRRSDGIEAKWKGLKRVADLAHEHHIYLLDWETIKVNSIPFPAYTWVGICSRCRITFDEVPLYGIQGKTLVMPGESETLICMDCIDRGKEIWKL